MIDQDRGCPNLAKAGTRTRCRACSNERSRSKDTGQKFDRERADRSYAEFMGITP